MAYEPHSSGLLAPIRSFMEDPAVSEIMLNRPGEVYVEKKQRIKRYPVPSFNTMMLNRLFQLIANENHQTLGPKRPLLSGSLLDGSRVQLVLPPVAEFHAFSIRKKVIQHYSLKDYQAQHFYQQAKPFYLNSHENSQRHQMEKKLSTLYREQQWCSFMYTAIQMKKNIVISGGTSSGKTTYLNACLNEISRHERLLIIEDAREIVVSHPNHCRLLVSKGGQGLADVSIQDLVQCSLRLRPDRIIIGEIRGKEVLDFISAASTGHEGSMTSIHANNPKLALMRMTQLYKQNAVPAMSEKDIYRELNAVIDIIIQLSKTPHGRRVTDVYFRDADG